jgi:UDP-N-acetylmuramoylalanine--D-glutamate ligase
LIQPLPLREVSPPFGAFTVVVGLGRSGAGAARLLQSLGSRVLVLESSGTPAQHLQARELRAGGIDVQLDCPLTIESFEARGPLPAAVVVSPGIRWDHPTLVELRNRGVRVCGEPSVAWAASRGLPWIGITGTNGKTTVTHLVSHLLQAAGLDAPMAGNMGTSAAELLLERRLRGEANPDWLVMELSSYQIEASPELAPAFGLWITLTPDHLERHGTLSNYRAIKRRLVENATVRLLNADDADLRAQAPNWDQADWVSAGPRAGLPAGIEPLIWIENGRLCSRDGELFDADSLALPGQHNQQNLVLAAAVGLKLGLDPAGMAAAFRRFPGVPHRLERICERAGITWYNDSKATNYDAAEVALKALPGPMVVLAGGQAKQGDASVWLAALQRQAAAVVVYGAASDHFAGLLLSSGFSGEVRNVEDLGAAVLAANALATASGSPTVLLSPACASFDQYSSFEARGNHFRALVAALNATPAAIE